MGKGLYLALKSLRSGAELYKRGLCKMTGGKSTGAYSWIEKLTMKGKEVDKGKLGGLLEEPMMKGEGKRLPLCKKKELGRTIPIS